MQEEVHTCTTASHQGQSVRLGLPNTYSHATLRVWPPILHSPHPQSILSPLLLQKHRFEHLVHMWRRRPLAIACRQGTRKMEVEQAGSAA